MSTTLIDSMGRLADVLARENAALAALDLSRAASMLAEKQDAASAFARAWEQARAADTVPIADPSRHARESGHPGPRAPTSVPSALDSRFRGNDDIGTGARDLLALARRLEAAAAENRRLLERGIAVQGRVLAVVARAVPRALGASPSPYGARGTAPPPAVRAPLALSLRA